MYRGKVIRVIHAEEVTTSLRGADRQSENRRPGPQTVERDSGERATKMRPVRDINIPKRNPGKTLKVINNSRRERLARTQAHWLHDSL